MRVAWWLFGIDGACGRRAENGWRIEAARDGHLRLLPWLGGCQQREGATSAARCPIRCILLRRQRRRRGSKPTRSPSALGAMQPLPDFHRQVFAPARRRSGAHADDRPLGKADSTLVPLVAMQKKRRWPSFGEGTAGREIGSSRLARWARCSASGFGFCARFGSSRSKLAHRRERRLLAADAAGSSEATGHRQ